MYAKKRTLHDRFTLINRKIDLPRDAVLDSIMMYCSVTVENTDAATWNATYDDILKAIKDIRVVSNSNNVHYSVSASDVAILNYYDHQGHTPNPDEAITIAASSSKTFNFLLMLDQGDIIAVSKNSLEMSMEVATAITEKVAIKDFTATITIEENVCDENGELYAVYGKTLELAAEPKIVAIEKSFDACGELREFMDLPTGTALNRAVLITKSAAGVRGAVTPDKVGIIVTTPDRRELYTVHYQTLQAWNQAAYCVPAALKGVSLINYATEITGDQYGLKGWTVNKGDQMVAVKSENDGRMRYISIEYVVNAAAVGRAILEATN